MDAKTKLEPDESAETKLRETSLKVSASDDVKSEVPLAGPLNFTSLPLDVKKYIVKYITRPTDLKNLCLTSKEFQDLATPHLYRVMSLFVGGSKDVLLVSMLSSDNPGVRHIREIHIRLERAVVDRIRLYHSDDSSGDEEGEENASIPARQAQLTVRLLLDFIPRNQLELFSWATWEPVSIDNYILLLQKQKKLRTIEVGPLDKPLVHLISDKYPNLVNGFSELRTLDVYPEALDRITVAQKLLEANPKIKNLTVSNGFEYASDPEDNPPDLHDSSTRPGLLMRMLFGHMLPFETCKPYLLSELDLDGIELRYAADTWLKIIKFDNMKKLEIRNCGGVDVLFAQLSKPHLRPSRLESLRWMDDDKSDAHAVEAFEGLLESISGLKTLDVYTNRVNSLPKLSPILRHKATLKSLSVHSQQNKDMQHYYSEDDFGQLCAECAQLRQLSVTFPRTNAEAALLAPDFMAYLECTWKLPNLVTLNIRRWPTFSTNFSGSAIRIAPSLLLYETHLQRLSQYIFDKSDEEAKVNGYGLGHRSNLSVVVWGGNGKTRHDPHDKYKLKQIPFVRGTKIDAFGQSSMLAVQTVWRMLRFVEPEVDILSHSLYDMHEIHHGAGL